ncbi:MAG TPA: TM1802 family CRISPR-associated protein [Candidatus Cloacimonadota bacterium]|nr:TM1802 family CRISPR-associated protein [Candidatus Cloacimonadota bacterium]
MISTYRLIGKGKMQSDHVSEMPSTEQKRYIIRQYCVDASSFEYRTKDDEAPKYGRILNLALDTQSKRICFSTGTEIGPGVCEEKLIFTNYAPADPNIYATHNSVKSIMAFSLLEYIRTNRNKIRWSKPEKVDGCVKYLNMIRDLFFVNDDYGLRPNYHLFPDDQQPGFPDPENLVTLQIAFEKNKLKEAKEKATKAYFEKQLSQITMDKQAYALTIDGKFVHEIEEVAESYLDVLYYHIIDKQFADSKNQGACHLCSEHAKLSEKVNLKHKFYGVTNPFYFDNASNSNSRTAFSMCKTCYNEVTVGMKYSGSAYTTYLIGLSCIILPDFEFTLREDDQLIDPLSLKNIPKLLSSNKKTQMAANLEIVQKLQTRLRGFSLLFHQKLTAKSQEFVVYQYIKGVNLSSLVKKTEHLVELSLAHGLPELFKSDYGLSFEGLRFLLLPSQESHPNLKPLEYQKINRDILGFLSIYLYSLSLSYDTIIKQFVDIHSRKRNNIGDYSTYALDLSAYIMTLYIKHLIHFNQLRGLKSREERNMTTTLEKASLLDYFANNSEVYQNNYLAQGLFIMGVYISEIEKKHRDKGIKRTVVHRLNLRGIPLQKVKSVMAMVDDLRVVWEVYNDPITDAYYRECMTKLSGSSFSPEETVFHILSGRAYNSYVGLMEYKKQQANKDSQEAQND